MCQDATSTAVEEVDVRTLVPAQRLEAIFAQIYELAFGASFILISDHDPKPLLHELEAEFPRQFFWTHLEEGRSVWRVEIGRREKTAQRSAGR
ncbi:MAG: DUF2249 domain-containing protein [Steroidobacteraceae bacterium]